MLVTCYYGKAVPMLDLHIHILPGVDDGAQDYEDSIGMADLALKSGIRTVCATPHANQMGRYENFYSLEFSRRYDRLQEMLRSNNLPLQILEGQEIMASDDMLEKILDGRLISLNGTQYYLVEFPFGSDPDWITDRLEDILSIDATPIIAHVERYHCVQYDPGFVYDWIRMGCVTQMNKGSMLGRFGNSVKETCMPLLNYELIHCLASDAHGPVRRTPWMRDAHEFLTNHFDSNYAEELLTINPRNILNGRSVKIYARDPSIIYQDTITE